MKTPDFIVQGTVDDILDRTGDQVRSLLLLSLVSADEIFSVLNVDAQRAVSSGGRIGSLVKRLTHNAEQDLASVVEHWDGFKDELERELAAELVLEQATNDWKAALEEGILSNIMKRILNTDKVVAEGSRQLSRVADSSDYRKAQGQVGKLRSLHKKYVGPVKWITRVSVVGVAITVGGGFPIYVAAASLALAYTYVVTGDMLDSREFLPKFWDGPAARIEALIPR